MTKCRLDLICVHPFGAYAKGERVTDPTEIKMLMKDRDRHFARVHAMMVDEIAPSTEAAK